MSSVLAEFVSAQELPDKIRGYKVQKVEVSVNDPNARSEKSATILFGEPELESVSVTGLKLSFQSKLLIEGQSGSVDFITFKDFEVNGIKVGIEEFTQPFEFQKGVEIDLPDAINVFVGTGQLAVGAYSEWKESKKQWRVRGRIFVFGKFRKFGFNFKRTVPVDVDFYIRNPLLPKTDSDDPAGDSGRDSGVIQEQRDIGFQRFSLAHIR